MTEARDQLQKLMECCICFQAFTDPRMLPCIHTFCLECLEKTGEAAKKKPGERIPCPLCRKVFVIPAEGMNGLQKNFFMQHLMDVTTMTQLGQEPVIGCDQCNGHHEGDEEKTKEATMRCLECRDNLCDICSKTHKLQKLSKTHRIVKIGSETEEDIRTMQPPRNCTVHNQQSLNLYCIDCKKIICVSCFVENHASHKCKDVTTVHQEFRQTIEKEAGKISKCVEEILSKGRMMAQRRTEGLLNLAETEDKIRQRNLELKEMIDSHTNCLMEQLLQIKQEQIKDFAIEKEETDGIHAILKSFETYCTELASKGSAGDVCSSFDGLTTRANELETDHEAFICRPFQITKVAFESTDVNELLSHPNLSFVGRIECMLIGSDISSRHQSSSSETSDNFRGKLDELAEKRSCETAISPDRTKAQTLGGYKRLLVDLYRKIADAGNDHSKITTFSEKEIAKFHSLNYLEDVKRELGLSDASKRFDGIQAKHTRMAALLFEMTKPDSDSSSDQMKSHLTELRSCIRELYNMMQFLVHRRNSERSLMPKGFQNFGNTCCFNSVMQCLLQTVLLSFGLNLNLYDLGNVLTGFTLSEVFMELASKYNYHEQRNGALKTLYYKFMDATQSFNDRRQHNSLDLLINFLDILRVEERNASKLSSAGPETQKILTAVDQIFGGQFITVYTCHSCEEPYAIRRSCLSVPLCSLIPDEQKVEESKIKPTTPSAFEAPRGITFRHDTSNKQIASRRFGTFFTESQQTVGGKYVDNLTSCETDLSSLSAIDEDGKASSFKIAIKNMLQPIAFEESAKHEAKNRLFRVFKTPNQNVSQCLKYLTSAEVIDSKHLCRNCHLQESNELRMTSATKRTLISSPPAILVLHLERFQQKPTGFAKREEMISYDELLDLGPFCSCSALRVDPEEENVWYSLYAVVVHCGFSISKGHYVAYVKQRDSSAQIEDQLREKFLQKNFDEREKVPNDDDLAAMEKRKAIKRREKAKRPHPIPGPWYYIRDDSVRSCDAKEALDQKAFLLFYERIPGNDQKTIGV